MNFEQFDEQTGAAIREICRMVAESGGQGILVGGCVRDAILGIAPKDADIEVYGLEPEQVERLLSAKFKIVAVGRAFGVLKIHGVPIDVSLPRRESKSGLGHKGFLVNSDPMMEYREAAARRDFTVNSMGFDPLKNEVIDPYGGRRDINARLLRHTSAQFSEDPLRVLRAMQFAARFDFEVAPETVALCRKIEPEGLPRERIFEEWSKLILKGVRPSRGLAFLRDCGWIRYYPELEAMIGCRQDPDWHPEGDVWVHTLHCMDAFAAERVGDEWEDLVVGLAVLCHDLGKPSTTEDDDGRIRSKGHEQAGEAPTRSFLARMTDQSDLIEAVVPHVVNHLRPQELHECNASDSAIRRLARKVGRIDRLVRVSRADQMGRPPKPFTGFPAGDWLLERAGALAVVYSTPPMIVMGRHLLEMGLTPGPSVGEVLSVCYEAQLEGKFTTLDEGLEFARTLLKKAEANGAVG